MKNEILRTEITKPMLKPYLILMLVMMLSACGGDAPAETPMPTEPPLIGGVRITSPQLGSVIYAEVLVVAGTIEGVDSFQLEIETVDGMALFDGEIQGHDGHWRLEIVHDYAGEPVETVIRAKSTDDRVSLQYDEVPILVSSLRFRDAGVFGTIWSPLPEQSLGGDSIEVMGTASGIPDSRLTILLRHDGGLIDQQVITLDNPYRVDERVWIANLLTNGFLGEATIEIAYVDIQTESEQILDTISILIVSEAG